MNNDEQSKADEGQSRLTVGLGATREKVLSTHPEAFVYLSGLFYHIAESTLHSAPTIGSGETEAAAWADAANVELTRLPERQSGGAKRNES